MQALDSGLSYQPRIGPNGELYVLYWNFNLEYRLLKSTDGGASFGTPRVIHGDSTPPRDQFHPWLEVGIDGRLHLMFFDTRNTPQLDADANGFLDVYYSTSIDRGDTWSETRVTPQPFESRFADWDQFDEQFVGDYLGLTATGDQVHLLYPSTSGGDLDIFSQTLDVGALFADGFESGDVSAWSLAVP